MKNKVFLSTIFILLILSLSSCVIFQKVMDVSGAWIVELSSSPAAQLRGFTDEANDSRSDSVYLSMRITQTGSQLTGKLYILALEANLTGTINEDNTIKLEASVPDLSSERNQDQRDTDTLILEGTVIPPKTIFNKTATQITGKFYNSDNTSNKTDFTATK